MTNQQTRTVEGAIAITVTVLTCTWFLIEPSYEALVALTIQFGSGISPLSQRRKLQAALAVALISFTVFETGILITHGSHWPSQKPKPEATGTIIPEATTTIVEPNQNAEPEATATTPKANQNPEPDGMTITIQPGQNPEPDGITITIQPDQNPEPDAVTKTELHLRKGPSKKYVSKGILNKETPLTITGKDITNIWLKVTTPNNENGWVHSGYLQINKDLSDILTIPTPPLIPNCSQ